MNISYKTTSTTTVKQPTLPIKQKTVTFPSHRGHIPQMNTFRNQALCSSTRVWVAINCTCVPVRSQMYNCPIDSPEDNQPPSHWAATAAEPELAAGHTFTPLRDCISFTKTQMLFHWAKTTEQSKPSAYQLQNIHVMQQDQTPCAQKIPSSSWNLFFLY